MTILETIIFELYSFIYNFFDSFGMVPELTMQRVKPPKGQKIEDNKSGGTVDLTLTQQTKFTKP